MPIRGAIFDLDGTLVDSGLDFDLMRREMGLPAGVPILEALADDDRHALRRWAILAEHEARGVERATLFPGVLEFLARLEARGVKQAVLTRNSRVSTLATLARFQIEVHLVHTRDDGPVKPDPAGIVRICRAWGFDPGECLMLGDYRYDIEAGRRAGTRTVLFTDGCQHRPLSPDEQADFTLTSFADPAFWTWLDEAE